MQKTDVLIIGAGILGAAIQFCQNHNLPYQQCGKLLVKTCSNIPVELELKR